MKKEDCFELGVVARAYSFKGEVILHIDSDYPEDYYNLDMFYLESNKQLIPFFIEETHLTNKVNQIRVRLDGIDSEEATKKVVKKKIYLPSDMLPELDDDQFYYHEIEGYMVINHQSGEPVGKITEILDNPSNPLIEVDLNGNEALFPFNENTIIEIKKEEKQLILDIPEGLIEMYS